MKTTFKKKFLAYARNFLQMLLRRYFTRLQKTKCPLYDYLLLKLKGLYHLQNRQVSQFNCIIINTDLTAQLFQA